MKPENIVQSFEVLPFVVKIRNINQSGTTDMKARLEINKLKEKEILTQTNCRNLWNDPNNCTENSKDRVKEEVDKSNNETKLNGQEKVEQKTKNKMKLKSLSSLTFQGFPLLHPNIWEPNLLFITSCMSVTFSNSSYLN